MGDENLTFPQFFAGFIGFVRAILAILLAEHHRGAH
jgi:hypothetical protein